MASAWLVCPKFTHFAGEVLKIGHPCPILSFEFCLTAKHRKNVTTAVHGGWRIYILELFNAGYSYAGIIGVFYIW
ncbi:hypothetical protein E4N78_12930 [Treponema denticola]|nr:hypothetical protein E4N78_12930 [Treponema denticola]